mmetsp:Transcript_6310/g.6861  ORF Transcript_6310/g.6861 Transcript_6310/m.6861 type:complete len:232 (+) Transcript_6310:22-717(+)
MSSLIRSLGMGGRDVELQKKDKKKHVKEIKPRRIRRIFSLKDYLFPDQLARNIHEESREHYLKYKIKHEDMHLRMEVLKIDCKDLKNKDVTGKSDPYIRIYAGVDFVVDHWTRLYKSPRFDDELCPTWDFTEKPLELHCKYNKMLLVEVWDYDRNNPDDFMGSMYIEPSFVMYISEVTQSPTVVLKCSALCPMLARGSNSIHSVKGTVELTLRPIHLGRRAAFTKNTKTKH